MVSFNAINREKKTKKRIVIRFQNSIRKRKTKKKLKIFFFWATEKEKRRALSEFEFHFLPDEEKRKTKMEVQFCFSTAKKNENIIWVSFSYAIENRWALRYTDYCSIIVLVFGRFSMYSPGHINPRGQDSLSTISFRAPIFRSGLEVRSNKNSYTNPVSTECILQTVKNAD